MSNEKWLGDIPSDLFLHQLVMPGSHDAGVYRDAATHKDISMKTPLVSPMRVRCQSLSILNQAVAGSRFFDCRVYLRSFPLHKYEGGKLIKEQQVPTLGHFAMDTLKGKGGGYGGSLETVITDALSFVRQHGTEFVILRFSHTQCTEHVADLLEQIYDRDGNDKFIFTGDVNIAQCRLSQLKGKVIMIFDSKFNKQRLSSEQTYQVNKKFQKIRSVEHKHGVRGLAAKGMHLFSKYKDKKACPNGLCTCGEFADTGKMEKMYKVAVDAAKEHQDHPEDHLCFIYWQLTGGYVETNTKNPQGGPHAKLADFLLDAFQSGAYKLPNVISHDFVSEETCSQIIKLNTDRKRIMAEIVARQIRR